VVTLFKQKVVSQKNDIFATVTPYNNLFCLRLSDHLHISETRGAQGAFLPLKNFSPPLEKCVGYSLKLGKSFKILGPSQKTLRSPWCPKLVAGLHLHGTNRPLKYVLRKNMSTLFRRSKRTPFRKMFSTKYHAKAT